jgi:short-subunit dehydrogenase
MDQASAIDFVQLHILGMHLLRTGRRGLYAGSGRLAGVALDTLGRLTLKIEQSMALVTGANGGLGQAFVAELLRRGAAKVYVGVRDKALAAPLTAMDERRVIPLTLDVTDAAQIDAAAAAARDVTLLINNAGFSAANGAMATSGLDGARKEMDVNYFGLLRVTRAFAPAMAAQGTGTIVNVLSFLSLVTMPLAGTYSASKAAGLALTRSLRAELSAKGIKVLAAMPVQIDTAMGQFTPDAKIPPQEAASDTLDSVEAGDAEFHPGALSRGAAAAFAANPAGLQAQLATLLPPSP